MLIQSFLGEEHIKSYELLFIKLNYLKKIDT